MTNHEMPEAPIHVILLRISRSDGCHMLLHVATTQLYPAELNQATILPAFHLTMPCSSRFFAPTPIRVPHPQWSFCSASTGSSNQRISCILLPVYGELSKCWFPEMTVMTHVGGGPLLGVIIREYVVKLRKILCNVKIYW